MTDSLFSRAVLSFKMVALGVAWVGSLAGCGSGPAPTVAVDGKVAFADGKPLTGGFIFLVPTKSDGWEASGQVRPDGTFRLESLGLDGAAPGEYKVRFALDPPASSGRARKKSATISLDRKYLDENTSEVVVTVPPGGGPLDIRLQ